jgi:hypothetical protein
MDGRLCSSLPASPEIHPVYPRDPSSKQTNVPEQNPNPAVLTPHAARKIGKLSRSPKDDKPPITPLLEQFAQKNPYRYTTSSDKALDQRKINTATPSPKPTPAEFKASQEELLFDLELEED